MKVFRSIVTGVVLAVILLGLPNIAQAAGPQPAILEDKFILGSNFTLDSGERLEGSLVVIGGNALLEPGSEITQDVVIVGGSLNASGRINRDVVAVGAQVLLNDAAVVGGDINIIGSNLNRAPGAQVEGQVQSFENAPFVFVPPVAGAPSGVDLGVHLLWQGLWMLLRVFVWAVLAVLAVLFLPKQVERTGRAVLTQPLMTFGLGLLTAIVAPIVLITLIVLLITCIAAPFAAVLLVIAWAFGMVAIGYEVGKRIAGLLKQEWAPAVSAGVGTFLLMLVLNGINAVVICVGWVIPAIVGMAGLGAVILTRFGTQEYPPVTPAAPAGLPPMAPPPPPAQDWPPAQTIAAIPAEPAAPAVPAIEAEPPPPPAEAEKS
jgi:hypothetical protein